MNFNTQHLLYHHQKQQEYEYMKGEMNTIIDITTTWRKRKMTTDFYARITFSITIRSSSINSSNSDILLLLQIINHGWLRSKIPYGILCYYPVFNLQYMVGIN